MKIPPRLKQGGIFFILVSKKDMKISRIDHIGIVVNDFAAAKEFFIDFGLKVLGEGDVEGDWVDRIVGFNDMKVTYLMMGTSDGEANIELIKFHQPINENGVQAALPNVLGMRHICFAVEDIESLVAKLQKKGFTLFGEIVNYQDIYKLCYITGPEGIILELAEKI
jgi:catechol 2,3-dioxygenase-like lactoylglutathione lyase family enzyme